MPSIARVQTADRTVNQLQNNIIQVMNPILKNPILFGTIISSQILSIGDNTINIGLTQPLQGWIIILQNAVADIFDKQSSNPTPSATLILNSSAAVTVSIYVF